MGEDKKLVEQPRLSSVAIFARKYDCPLVPVRIEARNSWLYYWFWKINEELRDITLFHELLNKKGKRYKITFGPVIRPDALAGDATDVAEALRVHTMVDLTTDKKWRPVE